MSVSMWPEKCGCVLFCFFFVSVFLVMSNTKYCHTITPTIVSEWYFYSLMMLLYCCSDGLWGMFVPPKICACGNGTIFRICKKKKKETFCFQWTNFNFGAHFIYFNSFHFFDLQQTNKKLKNIFFCCQKKFSLLISLTLYINIYIYIIAVTWCVVCAMLMIFYDSTFIHSFLIHSGL